MQCLELLLDYMRDEKPHCIIFTGEFNSRSQQWWPGDIENEEGVALDEFIESNNLTQLIDQPPHIMNESRSCIDLIITDQPNILVDYGVHPSLYKMCHHEIKYGKINLSVPPPPSYERKIWEYNNANIAEIQHTLQNIDWDKKFQNLHIDSMTDVFCNTLMTVLNKHIPNKIFTFSDRDPPWMTREIKTAIKRKHRVQCIRSLTAEEEIQQIGRE